MYLMKPFGLRIATSLLAAMIALTGSDSICLSDDNDERAASATSSSAESPEFRPFHVLPRQPAIISPLVLLVKNVQGEVTDSELVLGVVVNGQARAYPINMLNGPKREIINDTLGDQPVVAMWCHLCHSAIVFDRRVNDQVLTFQVSGMLWNRTLVMRDLETGSLWSLLLAKGMTGDMKDHGLKTIPSDLTTWVKWKSMHPDTTVLNISRSNNRFVREFYDEPRGFVFGFVADGPHHVSLETLRKARVMSFDLKRSPLIATFDETTFSTHLFSRRIKDQELSFELVAAETPTTVLMKDAQTQSVWDAYTGEAIEGPLKGTRLEQEIGTIAYSRNWKAFHPESIDLPIRDGNSQ